MRLSCLEYAAKKLFISQERQGTEVNIMTIKHKFRGLPRFLRCKGKVF